MAVQYGSGADCGYVESLSSVALFCVRTDGTKRTTIEM
jgi:hypothetical protein